MRVSCAIFERNKTVSLSLRLPIRRFFGFEPDILVETRKASEDDENSKKTRSEASLRGSLTKELSETDKKRLDEEEEKLNEKAKLQREDYQLSYAIDLLRGFSVLQQKN